MQALGASQGCGNAEGHTVVDIEVRAAQQERVATQSSQRRHHALRLDVGGVHERDEIEDKQLGRLDGLVQAEGGAAEKAIFGKREAVAGVGRARQSGGDQRCSVAGQGAAS